MWNSPPKGINDPSQKECLRESQGPPFIGEGEGWLGEICEMSGLVGFDNHSDPYNLGAHSSLSW